MMGKHLLRAWSATQATSAPSSAEAEFYALVEGATRGIGLQAVLEGLGVPTSVVELLTDSSSAKSFASRRGVGKLRHIDLKELWFQEAVKNGKVRLSKVAGELNPADILTKYQDLKRLLNLGGGVGLWTDGNQHELQVSAVGECWRQGSRHSRS